MPLFIVSVRLGLGLLDYGLTYGLKAMPLFIVSVRLGLGLLDYGFTYG